jgi:hypothetical protein
VAVVLASTGTFLAYASHTTSSVPVPAGVANGDIIVVHFYVDDSTPTVTPPSGFTELTFPTAPANLTAPIMRVRVYWKRATGADTGTYDFTHAAATTQGIATRYTGSVVSGTAVEALAGGARTSAGTTSPALTGTTAQNNELIVFSTYVYTSVSWTVMSGWTTIDNANGEYIAYKTQAAAGTTGSISATEGSSNGMVDALIGIFPSSSTVNLSLSDNLGLTDATTNTFTRAQAPSDNLGMTDSLIMARGFTPSDNLGMTDSVQAALGRNPDDTIGLTDAMSQVWTLNDTPSDDLNLTDLLQAQYIRPDINSYNFVMSEIGDALWVPFGLGQAIDLNKFTPGGPDIRHQDQPGVQGDYMTFGTDYRTPPLWSWQLWTNVYDPSDAADWADQFKQVWENAVRDMPGGVAPLRYCIDGRYRRVFGRPRRFTPVVDKINQGKIYITADFQLAEDVYYDDLESSVLLGIAPGWTGASGLVLPAVVPWTFSGSPAPRVGQVQIFGTKETWVDCTFTGPVVNPWVQIGNLTYGINGSIPLGYSMRLSGKPWQMGCYMSDGSWHPDMLDPRSRLSQLQLKPGLYPVTYGGADATGTSQVTVAWRTAHQSL